MQTEMNEELFTRSDSMAQMTLKNMDTADDNKGVNIH